jgi:hypothetical protein
MSLSIGIGDRVRVIDQDWITGTVVEDWGKRLVIIDDDAETDDDRLEFYVSDLKQIERGEMLKPNDKARIKGTCIVGSIARINKDICIFHDEEIDKFIKMETNKLEKLYE